MKRAPIIDDFSKAFIFQGQRILSYSKKGRDWTQFLGIFRLWWIYNLRQWVGSLMPMDMEETNDAWEEGNGLIFFFGVSICGLVRLAWGELAHVDPTFNYGKFTQNSE